MNDDGNPDLVAVNNNSDGYAIYLGHGDGTFTVTDAIMAEWQATWIAAGADFDRDCHLDIAVADYGTNKVYIMHGYGDGTFTLLPASYDIPGASVPEVGDFNTVARVGDTRETSIDVRHLLERELVAQRLREMGDDIGRTAESLGILRPNLYRKLKELDLDWQKPR